MKKLLLMGLLIGGLGCQTASAKIRTLDFTGVFTNLSSNGIYPSQSAPGIVDGSVVSVGDTFTGEFTFDDSELDWTDRWSSSKPAISMTVTFADGAAFSAASPRFGTSLNWNNSASFIFGSGNNPVEENPFINIALTSYLPFAWDLSSGTTGHATFSWSRPGVNVITMGNTITNLTERGVSPIPEPSTYAMLLLGAGVVACAARRKQRKAVG